RRRQVHPEAPRRGADPAGDHRAAQARLPPAARPLVPERAPADGGGPAARDARPQPRSARAGRGRVAVATVSRWRRRALHADLDPAEPRALVSRLPRRRCAADVSVEPTRDLRLAYVTPGFPDLTQSFVRREVEQVRAFGVPLV